MREAIFNTEVTNSLKRAGAWAYKIADAPASWTWKMTRFTVEKPCDIVFGYRGKFGAIEGKMMKRYRSFGLRDMRPSQIRELDDVVEKGNQAFVFLNVRMSGKRGPVVKGRWTGQARENRLIVFDWPVFRVMAEILPFSAKEIRAMPYVQGAKSGFDLSHVLTRFSV